MIDRDFRDDEALPIGRECDNCDVFLLTEDGRLASKGEEGELIVRGSFLASGYYIESRSPESTRSVLPLNSVAGLISWSISSNSFIGFTFVPFVFCSAGVCASISGVQ